MKDKNRLGNKPVFMLMRGEIFVVVGYGSFTTQIQHYVCKNEQKRAEMARGQKAETLYKTLFLRFYIGFQTSVNSRRRRDLNSNFSL